jgi:hypothetical protein
VLRRSSRKDKEELKGSSRKDKEKFKCIYIRREESGFGWFLRDSGIRARMKGSRFFSLICGSISSFLPSHVVRAR